MKTVTIPLNERIFTSRTLNLNAIRIFGFDMDYTLVVYNETRLEELAFHLTVQHLIDKLGYDEGVRQLHFKPDQIIRGLVIDKKLGTLIKINRFGYVKAALFGDHFSTRDEVREAYSDEIVSFSDQRYEMVHTMFSLALCSLFNQITEKRLVDKRYEEIYEDVSNALNYIHTQGTLKSELMADLGKYVLRDRRYADTLLMLRSFHKKLILITNSGWDFTQAVMSYCYDPFLPKGKKWRDLFGLVVVEASKPEFFYRGNKFYELIPEDGHLKNVSGSIRLNRIYQGGNALAIERLFDINRSQILYVGDHLYSDVYQSKKMCQWRTMLVISELEKELVSAQRAQVYLDEIKNRMKEKEQLELQLDVHRRQEFMEGAQHKRKSYEKQELNRKERVKRLDQEIGELVQKYDSHFNPYWGELMWAGNDKSYFAFSVERYACTYTSKVPNLLNYSPVHYFRPPMKSYDE